MLVRQVAEVHDHIPDCAFGIWPMPTVVRLVRWVYTRWMPLRRHARVVLSQGAESVSRHGDLHKPSVTGSEGIPDVSKSVSGVARSRGENRSGPG